MVKFSEKLSKMNKTRFLNELSIMFVISYLIYRLIKFRGYPEYVALIAFTGCICIAFSKSWNVHTSEHALSGNCIKWRSGYPEGTDLNEWKKRWKKNPSPKGGWYCSQTTLPGKSNCLEHALGKSWRSTTGNKKKRQVLSLEEERKQFLKEHSEVAKTLFGDRTDLTDDEWYDLAMAAGNPRHPADR